MLMAGGRRIAIEAHHADALWVLRRGRRLDGTPIPPRTVVVDLATGVRLSGSRGTVPVPELDQFEQLEHELEPNQQPKKD
jgi:hypothetical protein